MYEENKISGKNLKLLYESADWDLDHDFSAMNSWEFISNGLVNNWSIHLCLWLINKKILTDLAKNWIFATLKTAFEIVLCYIEANEITERKMRSFVNCN